jgi:cell division protein FtsQ
VLDPAVPVALPVASPPAPTTGPGPRERTPVLHALHRTRVSAASVQRFAARGRRRRLLSWRPLALVAGALALLVLAGWVVWSSPLLAAREVRLAGAQRVTQDEAAAAVAPELGRPLARLDADAVRQRLEALPEVRSVQVRRGWPSTVEVRVTERVPVAAVPAGEAYSLVDAAGVEVEQAAEPAGLPVVSAETVAAGDAPLLAAARVLQALPPELATQVTGTTAATPDSVVLTLASGAQVVWGSPDESPRKAAVLQVLLATPAEVYDVSAPGTPVTR